MKKLLIVALATLAFTVGAKSSFAQIEGPSPVGTKYVTARFAAGPGIGTTATFDYGVVDSWWEGLFTVGGYVGYGKVNDHNNYDRFYAPIALRATYRLNIARDFEVYGGAMSGFYLDTHSKSPIRKDNETDVKFLGAGLIGATYYITPSFGIVTELVGGSGTQVFNIGVNFRF